jgi:ABC-type transporter Mla MlaB component
MADTVVFYDVGWILRPDVHAVDALARLQLAAKRRGSTLVLENVSRELAELVELMGLSSTLRATSLEAT